MDLTRKHHTFVSPTPRILGACLVLAAAPACKQPRKFADPSLARASVDAVCQHWRNASAALDPGAATARGDHRFDAELEPPTEDRVRHHVEAMRRSKEDLAEYWSDRVATDVDADRRLIEGRIDAELLLFETLRVHERDLAWSAEVAMRALSSLEQCPDLPAADRGAAFVARARKLPAYLEGVRKTARNPWQTQAEVAAQVAASLESYLGGNVAERLGLAANDAKDAIATAREAARAHCDWVQQRVTLGPAGHHRVSRENFDALVRFESGLGADASAIAEVAQAELEGARRRFASAAAVAFPRAGTPEEAVAAATKALAADRALDAAALLAIADEAAREAYSFCKANLVVTVPDGLRVTPAVGVGTMGTGALATVESSFGSRTQVAEAVMRLAAPIHYLPAAAQEEWLSGLSPLRVRMLALSQGVPGVALERAVRAHNPAPSRRDVSCEGYERGWGDYARRVALEAGFGQTDPMMPVVSAATDLVVAARALCAARIHAGSMTVAEAREVFRRQAYLPGEVAGIEARRCASDPLVALELLGRIEFEKIVRELQGQRGISAVAARDRVLNTGALPFDALRTVLGL